MRVVLAVLIALLSGCALTGSSVPAADAAAGSAQGGDVRITNAFIPAPASGGYTAGSASTVEMLLTATGQEADALTSASTPAAGGVQMRVFDQEQERISVPPGDGVQASCELSDLSGPLAAGERVSLTLQFAAAGAVSLSVPVQ